MSGEYLKHIEVFPPKELPQLINRNSPYPHNLPIVLIVLRYRQLIKRLIIRFQFINNKFICKYKSLVVVPYLVHGLNEVVRITSLDDELDSRLHVELDELPNMYTDAVVEVGALLVGWFGSGEGVDGAVGCN